MPAVPLKLLSDPFRTIFQGYVNGIYTQVLVCTFMAIIPAQANSDARAGLIPERKNNLKNVMIKTDTYPCYLSLKTWNME